MGDKSLEKTFLPVLLQDEGSGCAQFCYQGQKIKAREF